MKNSVSILFIGTFLFLITSCGSKTQAPTNENAPNPETEQRVQTTRPEEPQVEKPKAVSTEFLGIYHGVQPGYTMKNKFGDDMIINGQKIKVPSVDYKFLLKEDNAVSLQQTSLEDNTRFYYDGTAKIIADDEKTLKLECAMSDGKTSKPVYTLTLDKTTMKGVCTGTNEPEFEVEKTK